MLLLLIFSSFTNDGISDETNCFAYNFLEVNAEEEAGNTYSGTWVDVDEIEMRNFVGLIFLTFNPSLLVCG